MMQVVSGPDMKSKAAVPEWLYRVSDEQFIAWCQQHKLQVCEEMRTFPQEERMAIFLYAVRQHLVN